MRGERKEGEDLERTLKALWLRDPSEKPEEQNLVGGVRGSGKKPWNGG